MTLNVVIMLHEKRHVQHWQNWSLNANEFILTQ